MRHCERHGYDRSSLTFRGVRRHSSPLVEHELAERPLGERERRLRRPDERVRVHYHDRRRKSYFGIRDISPDHRFADADANGSAQIKYHGAFELYF